MNPIREAIKTLPGNWIKGTMSDNDGNHCGLGHLACALRDYEDKFRPLRINIRGIALSAMHTVACEQYPERGENFVDFNDHPSTTEAEVIAVMEKAAVRFDEQV